MILFPVMTKCLTAETKILFKKKESWLRDLFHNQLFYLFCTLSMRPCRTLSRIGEKHKGEFKIGQVLKKQEV
jgi:hypothetical protein